MPSSSAADDYLNALKADSQRKQRDIQAKLSGKPLPPTEKPPLSASLPVDTAADAPHEVIPAHQGRVFVNMSIRMSHESRKIIVIDYRNILGFSLCVFVGYAPPPRRFVAVGLPLLLVVGSNGPGRPVHRSLFPTHLLLSLGFLFRPFDVVALPTPPGPTASTCSNFSPFRRAKNTIRSSRRSARPPRGASKTRRTSTWLP